MVQILVPDIGDVDEVEVIELCVSVGDTLAVDDPVVVIESDKASMEVPATEAGVVAALSVAVGDLVRQGDVLIELDGDTSSPAEPSAQEEPSAGQEPSASREPSAQEEPSAPAEPAASEQPAAPPPAPAPSAPSGGVVEVVLPDVGDAGDVVVIEMAVSAGDTVAEDDLLLVVESDKASMEIPSPHAGTVKELRVAVDDSVSTGTVLLLLETEAGAQAPAPAQDAQPAAESAAPAAPSAAEAAPSPAPAPTPSAAPERAAPAASAGKDVYAGPAVRRLARELGVDLSAVTGSGNRGRITKDDVKAFVKERMQSGGGAQAAASSGAGIPPIPAVDFAKFGPIELEPITRMRRVGAENLHRSWLNVPHVTQQDSADVTDLETFRKSLKSEAERRGIKVTPLAFIVKACCEVLKRHPRFNASLDPAGENFILKQYYHIGMAVDTEQGLIVPVIRDADSKGIFQLSQEIVELADKARAGKLGINELQGGTFSISSLGAIGGTGFTPIVNAPEVAILGVGRLSTEPVWDGAAFQPRKMLPLSLSYDHRAINGAEAGRFMTELCQVITDLRRAFL